MFDFSITQDHRFNIAVKSYQSGYRKNVKECGNCHITADHHGIVYEFIEKFFEKLQRVITIRDHYKDRQVNHKEQVDAVNDYYGLPNLKSA
jgi:nitrate/TMAO reductase-like tetraheme cytochrome c subunit